MSELTRRRAVAAYGSFLAASPLVEAQHLIGEPSGRIAPPGELVNTFEFEEMARRKLDPPDFALIAGSDHAALDRITFRPRLMNDVTKLSLSAEVLGQNLFAPIIVGPASQQKRFHPEGELAMVRGASAAKAVMVVSEQSSVPIDQIAAEAKTTLWYQVFPAADVNGARGRIQQAVAAGCKAVCVTIGAGEGSAMGGGASSALPTAGVDWSAIDKLRQGITVPLVVKGVMSPDEAQRAIGIGAKGIVVSNYSPRSLTGIASTIEVLPAIADAVGGKASILVDGSFRRGADVLKAIALGAQAVMISRPVLWGLAAYGSDGVQKVVETMQTELARDMAMCGKVNVTVVDKTLVKIHRR